MDYSKFEKVSIVKNSTAILTDCMDFMRGLPDGFFDLVIADPPYGIGASGKNKYHDGAFTTYSPKTWDSEIPGASFFSELFRVSTYQVVWGGNYFTEHLPPAKNWIVWDKSQPHGISLSMHELAFCNVPGQAAICRITNGSNANRCVVKSLSKQYQRIHPTQKPVALYKWLLTNYAKPCHKIFDPMMGSQSSRIAAWDMGFDYWGCELDGDYYREGEARFKAHKAKPVLFAPEQMYSFEQGNLFEEKHLVI